MKIIIKRGDPVKDGRILFELDNQIFVRRFDLPSRDVAEQVNYLKNSIVYLVYDIDKIIGFFAYEVKNKTEAEVKTMALLPEYQSKGIGQTMMKRVLLLLKKYKLKLATHPKNTQAIIFYLKSGFEIYGWKENYFGDGEPRLLLKRTKN